MNEDPIEVLQDLYHRGTKKLREDYGYGPWDENPASPRPLIDSELPGFSMASGPARIVSFEDYQNLIFFLRRLAKFLDEPE